MHNVKTDEVQTRKEHKCFGCRGVIPPKTKVARTVDVDMGKIFTCYFCPICVSVLNDWDDDDRRQGFSYGDVKDGDTETWEDHRSMLAERPTDEDR